MPTLEQLEHKLRLVEASRRRLQYAPWSTYSRSDTSKQVMSQITAQLRETEDELSRQKAMNEMMQHSTAAEIADLQSKCAHLEGQQADIDTLMSQNPSVASEIKKAYLTGKVEVQRTMRRTEKEIEGLRDALKHAEEKAVAAHGEVLELKTKYFETIRQKSSLYKHTQHLQQQVQDLQLQQVECVSSTIRNTQRAQQMSQRVMQSLTHAERRTPAPGAGDGEVATLRAENAILHEVLQGTLPHLDPAASCLVSTVTGTLRQPPQTCSSGDKTTSASLPSTLRRLDQAGGEFGQMEASAAHNPVNASNWAASPEQDCGSAGEGPDMLSTLRSVLGESNEPEQGAGSGIAPVEGPDDDDAGSSSGSAWSGDDVMLEASQTLQGSMPSSQARPAQPDAITAVPPGHAAPSLGTVRQVSFTRSTKLDSTEDSTPPPSAAMEDSRLDGEARREPLRLAKSTRRHKKSPRTRRDTMELSRVPRLAARLRTPVHVNSAVSFLQKLAKARTDGGSPAEPAEGPCMPVDGTAPQPTLQHVSAVPHHCGGGDDDDDAQMEKAKAIISAAVHRRKLGAQKAAADGADGPDTAKLAAAEPAQPEAVKHQQQAGAPTPGSMAQDSVGPERQCRRSDETREQAGAAPAAPGREHQDDPSGQAVPRPSMSMRMPDVHATSIAVANALRSIGSARGRGQGRGQPAVACGSSLRSRSPSLGPASGRARGGMEAKPLLTSTRLRHSHTPPRRCSLSPQRPPQCTKDTVIAELQAQTCTMASIMNEHMPWMINEVTRATREKAAPTTSPCQCTPQLSISMLAQKAQASVSVPAGVQCLQNGMLVAGHGSSGPATKPDSKRSVAKAAGDKYAATLMQPGMWRPHTAGSVRAGGAVTLHPPASHGIRLQQSLLRNSSV